MNLSKYVTLSEAIRSQTATRKGIGNNPDPEQIKKMKLVATKCFDPVREFANTALYISSFFRSVELNFEIGGSQTSQHCKAEAIDIDADVYGGISNREIFNYIKDNLDFDQLIWEFGDKNNPAWVHVSYKEVGNRKKVTYL